MLIEVMGKTINAHKTLVGKTKWRRPLTRPRFWLNDNIKIYFKEKRWDEMNWFHLAHNMF
jgi:hypothetical protein